MEDAAYVSEWDETVARGLESWNTAVKWHELKDGGLSLSTDQREIMNHKVREACDAFCTALTLVNKMWRRGSGSLNLEWMQRQLLSEKNISLALCALCDIPGAVHYMHSAICLLKDIENRYGKSPWIELLRVELSRMFYTLADRPVDREALPPMPIPML